MAGQRQDSGDNDDNGRCAQDDEVADGVKGHHEQQRDEDADAGDDQAHTAMEASGVGVGPRVNGPGDLPRAGSR